ncbi:MAG: NeuD/PglB/VioB family sugar acetyltransferase [Magnetococcales bacterium]|nr:NeuD/PglB/VioB family sugar acetyltransferase [Magnetococcales bacterium]
MNKCESLILLGCGGHGRVLLAALQAGGGKKDVIGIIDPVATKLRGTFAEIPLLGQEEELTFNYPPTEVSLLNGVGSVGSTAKRAEVYNKFLQDGYKFATVIHPTANIADDVVVGEGAQIMAGAIIQTGCSIGDNVLINSGVVVEHDTKIADHVHIATGAVVAGGVEIGVGAHIGCGATIIQGVVVGASSVVGAGAVVLDNVPDGVVVVGVPAAVLA